MDRETKSGMECLRCGTEMTIIGVKRFDEGTDWSSWIGEWGKLLNRKEQLDMIACMSCGKVEFFFDDVLTKNKFDE